MLDREEEIAPVTGMQSKSPAEHGSGPWKGADREIDQGEHGKKEF